MRRGRFLIYLVIVSALVISTLSTFTSAAESACVRDSQCGEDTIVCNLAGSSSYGSSRSWRDYYCDCPAGIDDDGYCDNALGQEVSGGICKFRDTDSLAVDCSSTKSCTSSDSNCAVRCGDARVGTGEECDSNGICCNDSSCTYKTRGTYCGGTPTVTECKLSGCMYSETHMECSGSSAQCTVSIDADRPTPRGSVCIEEDGVEQVVDVVEDLNAACSDNVRCSDSTTLTTRYYGCTGNTDYVCGDQVSPDVGWIDRDTDCTGLGANYRCTVENGLAACRPVQTTYCGDGITQTPNGNNENEECDDGDTDNTDGCIIDTTAPYMCKSAICGDGYVQSGEEDCDDGNDINTDACRNDCTLPPGTACDLTFCQNQNTANDAYRCSYAPPGTPAQHKWTSYSGTTCATHCWCGRPTYCGDGTRQSPNGEGVNEECDDGGTANNDGCDSACQWEPAITASVACTIGPVARNSVITVTGTWDWKGGALTSRYIHQKNPPDQLYTIISTGSSNSRSGIVTSSTTVTASMVGTYNFKTSGTVGGVTDESDTCTVEVVADPPSEICTNNIDDDSDGKTDFADRDLPACNCPMYYTAWGDSTKKTCLRCQPSRGSMRLGESVTFNTVEPTSVLTSSPLSACSFYVNNVAAGGHGSCEGDRSYVFTPTTTGTYTVNFKANSGESISCGTITVGETPCNNNGAQDNGETGQDCGGGGCGACEAPPVCPNGIIETGETCDDNNEDNTDACVDCQTAICGDGHVQAGVESCDDGNTENNDECTYPTCQLPSCSLTYCQYKSAQYTTWDCNPSPSGLDGAYTWTEESGATCGSATDNCYCGTPRCDNDGSPEGSEQCDDGNTENTDACISCVNARCGDRYVQAGVEQCDDGNDINTDACVACNNAVCGDSYIHSGVETCDDGNTNGGDGCSAICQIESTSCNGNNVCDPGESCGCDTCGACPATICGDNTVQTPNDDGVNEDCDGTDMGNWASCTDVGYDYGTLQCDSSCNYDTGGCALNQNPSVDIEADPNYGPAPLQSNIELLVEDEETVQYQVNFGEGSSTGVQTGTPPVTQSYSKNYNPANTYTATASATDRFGITVTDSETITACADGGSRTSDPARCCASTCPVQDGVDYLCVGSGACYSDDVCVSGVWHDRDEDPAYASLPDPSCSAGTWTTGCCEQPVHDEFTGYARCDTTPAPDSMYTCGDDDNERPDSYSRNSRVAGSGSWTSCMLDAGGCFGTDAGRNCRHYGGTQICSQAALDDDNDCDGLFPEEENECAGSITGTVYLVKADGSLEYAWNAPITITNQFDDITRLVTDSNGRFAADPVFMTDLSDSTDDVEIMASFLGYYTNYTYVDVDALEDVTLTIYMYERVCNNDCTNGLGWCDYECIGKNGCMTDPILYPESERDDRTRTLDACDTPGPGGRTPVEYTFLLQNETHRERAMCCASLPQWEPAPKAMITGNMKNLIKYTRLVTMNGEQARLVIASWKE